GFPTVAQDGRPPIEPGSLMPWMAYSPPRQWGDRRDESVGRATYHGKRRETRAGISGSSRELEFGRLLDSKLAWLLAAKDAALSQAGFQCVLVRRPPTGSNGHNSRTRSSARRRAARRRGSRVCSCSSITLAT